MDEAVIYEEDEESLEALEGAAESGKAGEASIFDAVDEAEPETVVVEPVFDMMDSDKEIELWEMLDGSYEELVQSYEVTVPEDTEFPVTITFDALVEADDDILVYHFMEDAGEWETIEPDSVEDGFVTATFNSLSPVGIVKIDDEKRDIADTLTYQEFTESMDGVEISVSGEIPEGYYLTVEALPTSDYADMITEATGNVAAVVYDIKITDGENEYQPLQYGKTLTVLFSGLDSVNEGRMNVVHIDEENGNVEQKSATIDTMNSASEISFETDSFSPYALVIATSRLEIEEGIDATLPFVDDYYGTSTSKIYHMYLTYNSSEKEAFCLDHGLAASTGDTFVQNGQYASSSEVQKILTAYFADENGNGYTLSYSEAQVLIWAAMAGYDTTSDTDSDGTLDYIQIMQAVGDNDESTNATAVATIEGITTYGTFYAWDPSSTYDESAGTYSRDSSKQRFVTLLGKAPVTAADVGADDLWQVGDNAYAYIDDAKVLHITGYGDCWNQTSGAKYTTGRGNYVPDGETVPYRTRTICAYGSWTSIEIGSEITGLGSYMFAGLSSNYANNITFSGTDVVYFGNSCFYGSYIAFGDIIIDNAEYIGTNAFSSGPSFSSFSISGDNTEFGVNVISSSYSRESGCTLVNYNVKNGSKSSSASGYPFGVSTYNGTTPIKLVIGNEVETIATQFFSNMGMNHIDTSTATNLWMIGSQAFSSNNYITEFTMPENVTNYGYSILGGCKNIERIYHNAISCTTYGSGDSAVDKTSPTTSISGTGVGVYGECGANNNNVELIIGENVEKLPVSFARNICMSTLTDNSSKLSCYPGCAFYGCSYLTTVNAANSNITQFHNGVFTYCTSLAEIDLSQYPLLEMLGAGCFGKTALVEITIPDSVTTVGTMQFAQCTSLVSATLGSGITELFRDGMFYADTALAEINYNCVNASYKQSYDVTGTEYTLLYGSAGLGTVASLMYTITNSGNMHPNYVPDHDTVCVVGPQVEVIGSSLFTSSDITVVDFSGASSLVEIGASAFSETPISGIIDIPEGVTTVGDGAFSVSTSTSSSNQTYLDHCRASLTGLVVPTTVETIQSAISGRRSVSSISFNAISANASYAYPNSSSMRTPFGGSEVGADASALVLSIGNSVELLSVGFAYDIPITSLVFEGNTLDRIPAYAFSWCTELTSVDIPDGVLYLEANSFSNCMKLVEITLPDSLQSIGYSGNYGAFYVNKSASTVDYDRDSDGINDALTTTLNCSNDNMVARTYSWLSRDNRYVANALSYEYVVNLPMSLELTDPGDGIFVNDLIVSISVVQALDNPLSVVLSKGTFKNADNVEWTDWSLDKTSPSGTVKAVGDYSFDCTVSGTPPTDGSFTGSITCTVTE